MKRATPHCSALVKTTLGICCVVGLFIAPQHAFGQRGPGAGAAGRHGPAPAPATAAPAHAAAAPRGRGPIAGGVAAQVPSRVGGPIRVAPPNRFPRFSGYPIFPQYGYFAGGYGAVWGGNLLSSNCGVYMGPGYGCSNGYILPPVYAYEQPQVALQYPPSFYGYPSAEDLTAGGNPVVGGLKEILIYLKDGTVYAVRKYLVMDGKLQYTTTYGDENSINLDRLDLQKTVDANAARGVKFSLTPPEPEPPAGPNATPNPAPPATTPQ